MRLKDIGEIGLIKYLAAKTRYDRSVVKGIGDDAAVIKWTKDKYLLFTCDMLIEDTHFRLGKATPCQIGHKALARNISDIAAMGGVPRYALVSVGLNPETKLSFADGIYKGIGALAGKFNINIVGGDTTRSQKLVIDISLIGEVEKRNLVLRSGAKKRDVVLVTGTLGGSRKGRHLNFMPRMAEARELVKRFRINSMIDISDGLILDLWRILDQSRVGCRLYKNLIPLSGQADSFEEAVSGGEDFELLFTIAPAEAERFFATRRSKIKTPVTLIGEITDRACGYRLIGENGREERLKPKGFLHF